MALPNAVADCLLTLHRCVHSQTHLYEPFASCRCQRLFLIIVVILVVVAISIMNMLKQLDIYFVAPVACVLMSSLGKERGEGGGRRQSLPRFRSLVVASDWLAQPALVELHCLPSLR